MSVENLQRLQVGLQVGTIPGDVARWLERALDAYLAGAASLEACLRVSPHRIRYARRNEIVHRLAQGLDGSPWERAGVLAEILQEYAENNFPNLVLNRRTTLLEAEQRNLPIPKSQSQLYRILTEQTD